MWLLGWGCGLDMSFGHAVAVMGILALGILLPGGPGLFGSFQLAISKALLLFFAAAVVGSQGVVYIFLMYLTQAVLISALGVIPLYALRIKFGDLLRTPPSDDLASQS
jgi:glycosyltransferase 2 family protein